MDWLSEWVIYLLREVDWLIEWVSEWVSEWETDIFIERGWLIDWVSEWGTDIFIERGWLIDWVSEWLLSDGYIYLERLIDWLGGKRVFFQGQGFKVN